MTNDEPKKKIVKILANCKCEECAVEYCADCEGNPSIEHCREKQQADALIAAGIGDVKDVEHRAKTLERAFRDFLAEYLTAVNEANSYDCGIPEMFGRYANVLPYEDKVTNLLNEYLQQAEKELAEERKDD